MHAQLWPLDWWAIVLPECWNIVQKYFFLYMLLANLITLFLLIYHLFNRSDYGLLKKKTSFRKSGKLMQSKMSLKQTSVQAVVWMVFGAWILTLLLAVMWCFSAVWKLQLSAWMISSHMCTESPKWKHSYCLSVYLLGKKKLITSLQNFRHKKCYINA